VSGSTLIRLTLLTGALAAAACSNSSRDPSPAPPPTTTPTAAPATAEKDAQPALKRGTVTLLGSQGERKITVEVVASPRAVERGLMYRQHLPIDEGMLFLMGGEEVQSFWMRNTLIPLDIIFIDKNFKIVGISENAEPRTETPRTVGIPSSYVLEVNGGWSAQNGVGAGTMVRFEGVEEAAH
jgi:uncharacterized protein